MSRIVVGNWRFFLQHPSRIYPTLAIRRGFEPPPVYGGCLLTIDGKIS
ncbi:hypothetical protein NG791_08200 [Laspinema sp. D1]|nr:hypothetical protein [Laspinema sp. D2b]